MKKRPYTLRFTKSFTKKILQMFMVATLSFSPLSSALAEGEQRTKPNIIYILADDAGYGDFGPYGQKEIKTPEIDRMAKEGVVFTNHYAGSTV